MFSNLSQEKLHITKTNLNVYATKFAIAFRLRMPTLSLLKLNFHLNFKISKWTAATFYSAQVFVTTCWKETLWCEMIAALSQKQFIEAWTSTCRSVFFSICTHVCLPYIVRIILFFITSRPRWLLKINNLLLTLDSISSRQWIDDIQCLEATEMLFHSLSLCACINETQFKQKCRTEEKRDGFLIKHFFWFFASSILFKR